MFRRLLDLLNENVDNSSGATMSTIIFDLQPYSLNTGPRPSQIKNFFDGKYTPGWHCVVGKSFNCSATYEAKTYIFFQVGPMAVEKIQNSTCGVSQCICIAIGHNHISKSFTHHHR